MNSLKTAKGFKRARANRRRALNKYYYHTLVESLETRVLLSVTPTIHFLNNQTTYIIGQGVHVDAVSSNLNGTAVTNVYYQWDFGDTTSTSLYNNLPGFNAAHVYDNPGTYTIKLSITDTSGTYTTTAVNNVVITADTRPQIYVDNVSGNDSFSGTSTAPVASITHALALVGATGADIWLKRGDTFSTSAGFTVNKSNVMIGAYGTGNAPTLVQTNTGSAASIGFSTNVSGITIQDLNFNQTGSGQDFGVAVGINITGVSNVTVRRNTVAGGVYTFIDLEKTGGPNGVLIEKNNAVILTHNFAYVWGTDIVALGNTSLGSVNEHNFRSYASQELVYDNDFTNNTTSSESGKSINTLRANNGNDIYWADNNVYSGVVMIGPLDHADSNNGNKLGTAGDPTLTVTNLVMEDNYLYSRPWFYDASTQQQQGSQERIQILAHVANIVIRNNIIESVNATAFSITTTSTETWVPETTGRTVVASNVDIYNNTVIDQPLGDGLMVGGTTPLTEGASGQFVAIYGTHANSVDLRNNLYVAPLLQIPLYTDSAINVIDTSTPLAAVLIGSKNNVWDLPPAGNTTGVNYITGSGYQTPAEWAANFSSKETGDTFVNIAVDSNYTPTGTNAAAADVGVTAPGVFTDIYGNLRPASAITVGAVQRLTGTVPAAPSGLTATPISTNQINLTWTDNSSNETGFKIDRATDSGFTQNIMTLTAEAGAVSYPDTGLATGTTYYYRVRATNAAGDSANSNTASAATLAPNIGIFTTDADIGSPAFPGSASYNSSTGVYSVTGGGADIWSTSDQFNFLSVSDSSDATIQAQVTSFTTTAGTNAPNTFTQAGVMFRNDSTTVDSAFAEMAFAPSGGGRFIFRYRTTAGGTVTQLTHTLTGTLFSTPGWIRLTRVGNNFSAYYSSDNVTWSQLGTTQAITMNTTIQTGLDVCAHDNTIAVTSTFSNVTITPDPITPTSLTATAISSSQINLAWTDTDPSITGYTVQRATDSGFTLNIQNFTINTNTPAYSDTTSLTPGTQYYYRVYATNVTGNSTNSNTATATPPLPVPPAAPSGLSVTALSGTQITLSWTDNSTTETSFKIDRSTSSDFTQNLNTFMTSGGSTTAGTGAASYTDTTLSANGIYYYRVRSTNAAGDSANTSIEAAGVFNPSPPSTPTAYTLELNATNTQLVINAATPLTVATSTLESLYLAGSSGDDSLTLDLTNGNPVPSAGMTFNGGAHVSGDAILIHGSLIGAPLTITNNQITIGNTSSKSLAYSNVEKLSADSDLGATGTLPALSVTGATFNLTASQHLAGLILNPAGLVQMPAGQNLVLATNGISFAGGTLDLANDSLLWHNGSTSTIRSALHSGYDSGLWDGTGLRSTLAASSIMALAYVGGNDYITDKGSNPPPTLGGQGIVSTDVIVMYAFAGDANLDGQITTADYAKMESGFLFLPYTAGNALWVNGDFNYDGLVNSLDYALINAADGH